MLNLRMSLAGLTCVLLCGPAMAEDMPAPTMKVSIESQPLEDALNDFAKQTGYQVLFQSDAVLRQIAPRVDGDLTPETALKALLVNSRLQYKFVNPRTVSISTADERVSVARTQELRLAQTDAGASTDASATERGGEHEAGSSDAEVQDVKLEEIVVTAQRRKEVLQNVPISITVLSGADLDSSTGSGLEEALRDAPGITSMDSLYTGGSVQYAVRGISAHGAYNAGSGPIAFYLDGVPYGFVRNAFYPDPNVFDLNSVEFLSGPQGTLYGAGSLNGVVRVLTHDANADEFELKARSLVSMTEGGGTNYGGDVAVNVPLIDGVLGARAVMGYRNESGWIDVNNPDPAQANNPLNFRKDVNDAEISNYRLRVHAQPSSTLEIDLSAWHVNDERGGPSQSNADFETNAMQRQPQAQDFTTYSARVSKEFARFSLVSVTNFSKFASGGPVSGEPVFAPLWLDTNWDAEIFSQEFNLVSASDGPWSWSAGVFYRSSEERRFTMYDFFDPNFPVPDFVQNDYRDTSDSYAIFGEVARDLTDTLELAVGLRYFHDKQTMQLGKEYSNANSGVTLPLGTEFSPSFQSTTPRVVLTWRPSENHSLYASYAQGFRSGFTQEPNVLVIDPTFGPIEPDLLTNYEAGSKGLLLNGALSYEVAVFYINWQDVQQTQLVPIPNTPLVATAVVNVEGASGPGASLSVQAHPLEGFKFGVNASWNDLTADATIDNLIQKGGRLSLSPEYTIGANARYEWELGGGYQASVAANANYKSPITSYDNTLDATFEADLRLTLDAPSSWSLSLFADNVTNEANAVAGDPSPYWFAYQRPRVFGVQLEYRFGRK